MDQAETLFFHEALRLSQALRPAPPFAAPPVPPNAAPPGMVKCACGKKNMPFAEVRFHNSPFVQGITDGICRECWPWYKQHTMVVCIKCRSVVARMAPERCPSGFVLRPGGLVHTNGCPNCIKDVVVTFLIEKAFFDHANGYPVRPEILAGLGINKK